MEPATQADLDTVAAQLGRPPRATRGVAHRCPCGNPDVVETSPRLDDGTPLATLLGALLTSPESAAVVPRLEAIRRGWPSRGDGFWVALVDAAGEA